MSENCKRYPQKVAERKAQRAAATHPLRDQLVELLMAVKWCETVWAIEDRVQKDLE